MIHPLTPREKVAAILDPEIWADDIPVPTRAAVTDFHARRQASIVKADAILTALASGSGDHSGGVTNMGDHAELARLAEAAKNEWPEGKWFRDYELEYGERGQVDKVDAAFIAAANPAAVLALLAENAALRERNECLERVSSEQSVRVMRQATRATEAERKLAEAREWIGKLDCECDPAWSSRQCGRCTFLSKEAERG